MSTTMMEPSGSSAAAVRDSPARVTSEIVATPTRPNRNNNASPTPSAGTPNSSVRQHSSATRRPPRKSTLTQQQKNQKRQRATQDQLAVLEHEFMKNHTPTAAVRERIADEISMTERSVQIWFQNRRAKIKLLTKKSIETGEDIDTIPESMRTYLAMQAMESGKGLGGHFFGRAGMVPYGGSMLLGGEQGGQGKVLIHHLTCRSLTIGKWTRVGQATMDLIIFYSPEKCTMTYYINNDQSGYKIEYNFSAIKNIYLENGDGEHKVGGIVIELNRPPNFFMDSSPNSNGFFQCGDFTEDTQASQCFVHHLGGNPKHLSGQLAKLVSLESFMNRHAHSAHHPFLDQGHQITMSAPVSPTGIGRPSSQPNFAQPHVGMYQESQWGIHSPQGMRGPGHRRQRSRSVPMPVDFAMFHQPMPAFYIEHPNESQSHAHHHPQSPGIFAPVPQHAHPMSPVGPNLRIDTQAGYGMDLRGYPLSAATTTPSEYSSPGFYSQAEASTPMATSSYGTPYGSSFLSPMVHPSSMGQSVSPIPFNHHGHADPAIVENSPPMGLMRSGSADIYPIGESAVSDDGHSLNEMYSKHSINLPLHHPNSPPYTEGGPGDMDMNQLVQFDSMDHASMSPEHMPQQH